MANLLDWWHKAGIANNHPHLDLPPSKGEETLLREVR